LEILGRTLNFNGIGAGAASKGASTVTPSIDTSADTPALRGRRRCSVNGNSFKFGTKFALGPPKIVGLL
jgi:hypothetical protein